MGAKQGSVFGGTLLITGSCIGAGMLGLPVLTGIAGFVPSFFMLVAAWLFMTTTSLLMVEILGWFKRPVNLLSMVSHTLGPAGRLLCWCLYLFLFYALLVAYMVASGNHASVAAGHYLHLAISDWMGTVFFVVLFGSIVYFGTRPVDHWNRVLMVGLVGAFALLIFLGIYYVTPKLLMHSTPKYALFSFPILIISFGFQNMIPSLMQYMGGNRKRVRRSIWAGSIFALVIYLVWELVALGILPMKLILKSYRMDIDAAQTLRAFLGSSVIGYAAQFFAFFAILTSFLAQSLSLVHFLRDGFKLSHRKREHIGMCFLALVPPLVFSILFPQIFYQAINFAGGICAVVLFGIMPALMTWVGRYHKKQLLADRVPGGRILLIVILLFAAFIFFYQATQMMDLSIFPKPKI